jgi:hypothetical protein
MKIIMIYLLSVNVAFASLTLEKTDVPTYEVYSMAKINDTKVNVLTKKELQMLKYIKKIQQTRETLEYFYNLFNKKKLAENRMYKEFSWGLHLNKKRSKKLKKYAGKNPKVLLAIKKLEEDTPIDLVAKQFIKNHKKNEISAKPEKKMIALTEKETRIKKEQEKAWELSRKKTLLDLKKEGLVKVKKIKKEIVKKKPTKKKVVVKEAVSKQEKNVKQDVVKKKIEAKPIIKEEKEDKDLDDDFDKMVKKEQVVEKLKNIVIVRKAPKPKPIEKTPIKKVVTPEFKETVEMNKLLMIELKAMRKELKLLKKEMQPKKEKKKEIVVKQEKKEFKDVSIDIVTEEGTKPMKILVKETKKAVKVEEVSDEDLMQISNGPIY